MNLKKGTEITIDERNEKWRRVYQILPSENHTRNSFPSVISIYIFSFYSPYAKFFSFFFLLSIREIQLGLHPQPTPTPQKNEKKNEKDNAVINQPLFSRVKKTKKKKIPRIFFSKKFSLLASSLIPFGSRASQKKKIHLSQSLGLRRYFHHSYEVRNEGGD